jgi:NADPH:quinone reductase-like Zn-dependent oxidoreductase
MTGNTAVYRMSPSARSRHPTTEAAASVRQNREELLAVTGLIEDGKLTPVVDRTYPLADTAESLRYVEQGHARGKAVVTVA